MNCSLLNVVIFAKFYFPFEAKLAMKIAGVDGTLEFVVSTSLSETRENLPRKEALSRTGNPLSLLASFLPPAFCLLYL